MASSSKCPARPCGRTLGKRQTIKKIGQRRHDLLAREASDQGLDETAKHCGHQHRRSRTVRWQPRSNSVDGSSGVCRRGGWTVAIRLHIDPSAALSITSRTELDKAKHIEIQHLWLQEAVRNNKLTGIMSLPKQALPTWARSTSRARDRKC